jgi:hypothetical protein
MGTTASRSPIWVAHRPSTLAGCWALDLHWDPVHNCRTAVGQLVYEAKSYDGKPGNRDSAQQLVDKMADAARTFRAIGEPPRDR